MSHETTTADRLREIVTDYAKHINAAASGELYRDEKGEFVILAWETGDHEDLTPVDVTDYIIHNSLGDIRYEVGPDMECHGGARAPRLRRTECVAPPRLRGRLLGL